MMRISVTTLESFRLYMHPDNDWMTEAELLATIRGEFVPTHKVDLGQAFGKVLEKPQAYEVAGGYVFGDFYFSDDLVSPCLDVFDRRGVFEAKGVKQYGSALVVAKADQLLGAGIHENKTTLGSFDFDKYAESCQWRFELDMFEADSCTYHVFCLSEPKATGGVTLRAIETFSLYPYAGLHRDCEALVREFVGYVKLRGLTGILEERQREAEERAVIV